MTTTGGVGRYFRIFGHWFGHDTTDEFQLIFSFLADNVITTATSEGPEKFTFLKIENGDAVFRVKEDFILRISNHKTYFSTRQIVRIPMH